NIAFLKAEENSCETDPTDCPPYTFDDIKEIVVVICMNPVYTQEEFDKVFLKMLACEDDNCKFRL
uniref:Uncharacterized protein n=1 Tax=Caenorhabditis japonica TaxID=281687 RepID=A0A8R1EL31_CAEJA